MFAEYAAGLFDGEGSVDVAIYHKNKRVGVYPRCSISNSNREALEAIKKVYGGNIHTQIRNRGTPCHIWKIMRIKDCIRFLNEIEPFSIVKKKQIQIMLRVLNKLEAGLQKDREGLIAILQDVKELQNIPLRRKQKGRQNIEILIEQLASGRLMPCSRSHFTDEEKEIIRKNAGFLTSVEIAKLIDRTPSAIRNFMKRNNIEGFKRGDKNKFTKLERIRKIVKEVYGLELSIGELNTFIKNELERLYWIEKLPLKEIAKKFKVPTPTIYHWLKAFNIRRRSLSEALKLRHQRGRAGDRNR
jgi:predicted DNA-binding protein YlxM (UPF0122 family)